MGLFVACPVSQVVGLTIIIIHLHSLGGQLIIYPVKCRFNEYGDRQGAWFRCRIWRRAKTSVKREYSWRNPLMPMLHILKLMGRIPYYRDDKDATLKFKVFSGPMMWAVVSTCSQITLLALIYYRKLSNSQYWMNFDQSLMSIKELIILNSTFHGLEATWAATPAIVRAVNRLEAYHRKFYAVAGRPVSSSFLDHSYLGLVVILLPSLQLFALHQFMGDVVSLFHLVKEVVYCLCIYYLYLVFWLWITLCSLIARAGEVLQDSLLESSAKLPTPEMFYIHRDLWLELHACSKDMASALATTLISWKILLFSIVVFGSYGIVVYIKPFNPVLIGAYIVACCNVHFIGFVTYSSGDFAQQALELLIDSVQMGKPCFEMRQFFIFERRTHITMFELLLTYLVVIMQLNEQSSSGEDNTN